MKRPLNAEQKIENIEIEIRSKKETDGEGPEGHSEGPNGEGEILFKGYANVVPIRGKQSSLDYYLMVLSHELFT